MGGGFGGAKEGRGVRADLPSRARHPKQACALTPRHHPFDLAALVFCMEFLEQNLDWLRERLQPLLASNTYILLDLPGQAELFSLHACVRNIVATMTRDWGLSLVAVLLLDAHLCADAGKYLAGALEALGAMLHLELPHVNVLSKIDLLRGYGPLDFDLRFYTDARDLGRLAGEGGSGRHAHFSARFARLSAALCEVVEDYGLLHFTPLAIEDEACVGRVAALADRAAGWVDVGSGGALPAAAAAQPRDPEDDALLDMVQTKYLEGGGAGGEEEGEEGESGEE